MKDAILTPRELQKYQMKYFKALQKSNDRERPAKRARKDDKQPQTVGAALQTKAPDLLVDESATIGKPSVVSNGSVRSDKTNEVGVSLPKEAYREATVNPQRVNPCLVAITQPSSGEAEEYRNLRTTVLQMSKKQRLRSIVIASVAPGEGKSITALNLAWLLAQTEGVTALVIDGDLRLPSLSGYLGVDSKPGLSDVMDGDVELSEAIIKLNPAGLHLLPGGNVRPDVAELLSGPTFAGIIEEATDRFDHVIIDAPPLGVFADAKILINGTDGALLVIRSNYTHYKTLDRILEDLPAERLLGVVMNDSEEALIKGDYYDYRYYGRISPDAGSY